VKVKSNQRNERILIKLIHQPLLWRCVVCVCESEHVCDCYNWVKDGDNLQPQTRLRIHFAPRMALNHWRWLFTFLSLLLVSCIIKIFICSLLAGGFPFPIFRLSPTCVSDAISWKPTASDVNLLLFRLCSPALRRIKVKNACNKRTKAFSTPPRPLIHTDGSRPLLIHTYTCTPFCRVDCLRFLNKQKAKKETDWQTLRRHLWCPLAKQQPKSWISVNSCKCMCGRDPGVCAWVWGVGVGVWVGSCEKQAMWQ